MLNYVIITTVMQVLLVRVGTIIISFYKWGHWGTVELVCWRSHCCQIAKSELDPRSSGSISSSVIFC